MYFFLSLKADLCTYFQQEKAEQPHRNVCVMYVYLCFIGCFNLYVIFRTSETCSVGLFAGKSPLARELSMQPCR